MTYTDHGCRFAIPDWSQTFYCGPCGNPMDEHRWWWRLGGKVRVWDQARKRRKSA